MAKNLFYLFISAISILNIVSCSKKKTISVNITGRVSFFEVNASTIGYKNIDAIAYAKKYASVNDNSCGVYNNNPNAKLSDCAHFIAHCLKNGGIEIKAAQPNAAICPDGLCYRVEELTSALATSCR